MKMPITLRTAHATSSRSACVRFGRVNWLLNDQEAGHVSERLHRTAVPIYGARAARHEALPVVDACLTGPEREGDLVVAARGRGWVQLREGYEDAEVGDREAVSQG